MTSPSASPSSLNRVADSDWPIALLCNIVDMGGMLTQSQINLLHFRPDLAAKLNYWLQDLTATQFYLDTYPWGFLNERIALLKWLSDLKTHHPETFAELDCNLTGGIPFKPQADKTANQVQQKQQLKEERQRYKQEGGAWLRWAIGQVALPASFVAQGYGQVTEIGQSKRDLVKILSGWLDSEQVMGLLDQYDYSDLCLRVQLAQWLLDLKVHQPDRFAQLDPILGAKDSVAKPDITTMTARLNQEAEQAYRDQGKAWLQRVIKYPQLPDWVNKTISSSVDEAPLTERLMYWLQDELVVYGLLEQYPPEQSNHLWQRASLLAYLIALPVDQRQTLKGGKLLQGLPKPVDVQSQIARAQKQAETAFGSAMYAWLSEALKISEFLPTSFVKRPKHPSQLFSSYGPEATKSLETLGWLVQDERPVKSRTAGRGETLWYLTTDGRREVAKHRKIPLARVKNTPVGTFNNDQTYFHNRDVTNLRISMQLAADQHQYSIQWFSEQQVYQWHKPYPVTLLKDPKDPTSEVSEVVTVDLYCVIKTHSLAFYNFIEMDRGSESINRSISKEENVEYLRWKVRKAGEFMKHHYAEVYPEAILTLDSGRQIMQGRWLFVLPSQKRLQATAAMIRTEAGVAAKRYLLTLNDWITPNIYEPFGYKALKGSICVRADQPDILRPFVWEQDDPKWD